jgi:DNA (cytosine-5)-methyltransferase 1
MSYKVGSLFAGIGGICYGFKQAGCSVLWANEIDDKACNTYKLNHKNSKLYCNDIHNDEWKKNLPQIDIITSGFPCQAFSLAGLRKGFEDPRGNLFFETAKFIDNYQPKAFLLENVKNLTTHDNGNTFKVIENVITKDLGYSFIPMVLNSKDYGNTPQNRERIYIVGFKDEASLVPNFITAKKLSKNCTENFKTLEKIPLNKKIKDILESKKQDDKYYFHADHPYIKEGKLVEMTSEDSIYQWRRIYLRENAKGLCPTLTANMGTGGHNVPLIKDKFGLRKLTPSECIKFQGFPDSFRFPKKMSNSACYKQTGNSVVVPVVKRIADEMVRVLNIKFEN